MLPYVPMETVEDIKRAIERLTVSDRQLLDRWLHEFDDAWDRQIAHDAFAGKLELLFREVDARIDGGKG